MCSQGFGFNHRSWPLPVLYLSAYLAIRSHAWVSLTGLKSVYWSASQILVKKSRDCNPFPEVSSVAIYGVVFFAGQFGLWPLVVISVCLYMTTSV